MPPPLIVDPREIDIADVLFGPEEIRKRNPHRFEFELLHGVLHFDPEERLTIGVHHTKEDDFWVRGHIPGQPLMPGVMMIEFAAQLCSFYFCEQHPNVPRFFGFGGVDNTRFRGTVRPGESMVAVAKAINIRTRRGIFDCQGFVGNTMVFETRVTGMLV